MIELLRRLVVWAWRGIFPRKPLWEVWVKFPPDEPRLICRVRGSEDDAEDEARAHVARVTLERRAPVHAEFMVRRALG